MEIKIALAGNPNCGKTTLFNALTGANQFVGNWPGVTVEKKEGRLKGEKDVIITDLPGIYSLSPYTMEEVVGAFGTLFAVAGDALEMVEEGDFAGLVNIAAQFTQLSAYSFLIFNLLCAPCFAAIGAIKREMNNAKWTWAAIGWECGFAYAVALIVYQIGGLFTGDTTFGVGTVAAVIVLGVLIYLIVRPYKESEEMEVKYTGK